MSNKRMHATASYINLQNDVQPAAHDPKRSSENSHNMKLPLILPTFLLSMGALTAQEVTEPLHLAISKVGNSIAMFNKGDELHFTLMAEIGSCLNFSLNGEFEKASIEKARVVAPDGKTYDLEALGEQTPDRDGNFGRFLWIKFGEAQTGFSIGRWKVKVDFTVDGKSHTHEAEYYITWRKPDDGIWGNQSWANEAENETNKNR